MVSIQYDHSPDEKLNKILLQNRDCITCLVFSLSM